MRYVLASATICLTMGAGVARATPIIDGVISSGEWSSATAFNISTCIANGCGNKGTGVGPSVGTAYIRADQNRVYAAFDITGWTAAMGSASHGNTMGFSVGLTGNNYPAGSWITFAQSSIGANTLPGVSGVMNGLDSFYDVEDKAATVIPSDLQAADSFAAGHRVWEVSMSLSHLGVLSPGEKLNIVGGINFDSTQHWYPESFAANKYANPASYGLITVQGSNVPEPATFALFVLGLAGVGWMRRRAA